MEAPLTAIELTGTIDEQHHLQLDGPLPVAGPKRVRVIVLYPVDEGDDELEWRHAAARNPAFHFLREEPDVYSLADGKPFHDEAKVVLVPFPFDDLSSHKVRPAVCLTSPIGPHQHVVLAFITSRIPDHPLDTDLVLDPSSPDFATTGLHVPSTLQLHRLMTATTHFIQRELGALSPAWQLQVEQRLRKVFGLR